MDTKALRQKILDLAIRGKLVPQDPNDEPASALLERIREEKKQMVKEGKLKAKDIKNDTIIFKGEDNLHYEKFQDGTVKCIEDEIPFEVPDSWSYIRLKDIISLSSGKLIKVRQLEEGGEYPVYGGNGINGYYSEYNVEKDTIIIGRVGFYCGSIHLTSARAWVTDNALIVTVKAPVYIQDYFVQILCALELGKTSVSTAQPVVSGKGILPLIVPIPPISEQKRILSLYSQMTNEVDTLEVEKNALSESVSAAKAKILDLAIRGKLVPQRADDEPASVLLNRIRLEKEELIKRGKLKRDKKESIIYKGDDNSYYEKLDDGSTINIDEDLPFDIPETWCWSRLSSMCRKEIKRGKAPKYSESSGTLVFAQKCNLKKGGIDYTLAQYLDESTLSKYDDSEFIRCGDTIINSTGTGTLGRVGFIDSLSEHPIVPDSHVTTIRTIAEMDPFYIFILLKSLQPTLEKSGEGSTNQKELKPNTLQDIFVPIPPIEEQKRLCKAVHDSYAILKDIEDSIN